MINSDNRVKIAFIVLHYQALEDTLKCIESIKQMNEKEDIKIVLVDNCSPNGSGQDLSESFRSDDSVVVLLSETNLGFSKANNWGCDYARDHWNPLFYVVANNDISFPQKDFCFRVSELYDKYRFYVLGPDIFNTRQGNHQSPISKDKPSMFRARLTVILNEICLSLFCLTYPFMKWWFRRLYSKAEDKEEYQVEHTDVCLQGACLIFSEQYAKERTHFFYPETFFFSEEALLKLWCEREEKGMVYSPYIQVLHNESSSTLADKDIKRRIKFQMRNIIQSTKIYISELKRDIYV